MGNFCPNTKTAEYKELLLAINSRNIAHLIWKRNKGNAIDLDPNGNKSKLFESLLEITNNDRAEAIRLKSLFYLDNNPYGEWWENYEFEPKVDTKEVLSYKNFDKAVSMSVATSILNRLSKKFGYAWEFDVSLGPGVGGIVETNRDGSLVVKINPLYMNLESQIHEFSHILIAYIQLHNKPLFDRLKKEIDSSEEGKKTLAKVMELYGLETKSTAAYVETIAKLLGEYGSDLIDKETGLFKIISKVWEYIKQLLVDAFGIVDVKSLKPSTTLTELALMIADPSVNFNFGDVVFSEDQIVNLMNYNEIQHKLEGQQPHQKLTPEDIKNKILEHSKQFVFETDENIAQKKGHFKYDKGDGVFEYLEGVGTRIKRFGYGSTQKVDESNYKVQIGKVTHGLLENIFKDVSEDLSKEGQIVFRKKAKDSIAKIAKDIKKDFVALSEVVIGDIDSGLCGVIDLILISPDGKVMLYDFKTKERGLYINQEGEKTLARSSFTSYDKIFKRHSQKEVNHLQLSIYAYMLQKVLKIPVSSISIVPLDAIIEGRYVKEKGKTYSNFVPDRDEKGKVVVQDVIPYQEDEGMIEMPFYDKRGLMKLHSSTKIIVEGESAYLNKDTLSTKTKEDVEDEEDKIFIDIKESESESTKLLEKLTKELEARIKVSRKRANFKRRKSLLDLKEDIEASESSTEALEAIIVNASEEIKKLEEEIKDFKEGKKEFTPGMLYKWREAIASYKSLEEIQSALYNNPDIIPNKKTIDLLDNLIKGIRAIESLYDIKGRHLIAQFLTPYYNGIRVKMEDSIKAEYRRIKHKEVKVNKLSLNEFEEKYGTINEYVSKRINEKKIEKDTYDLLYRELEVASSDVNVMTRWIDNMLDISDPVASALVNVIAQLHEKSRLKAIDKKYELIEAVSELQKAYPKKTMQSEADYYSFMLEHDKSGNPTGFLLRPYMSSFWEEAKNIRSEFRGKLSSSEIAERIRDFKKEHSEFDNEAFAEALNDFLNELYNAPTPEITKEELVAIAEYMQINPIVSIDDIASLEEVSEEVASKLENWKRKNMSLFYTYSEEYTNPEWKHFMKRCGIDTNQSLYKQHKEFMVSNNPFAKFYRFIENMSNEANLNIPNGYRLYYRLPGVVKLNNERLKEGQNALDIIKSNLDVTFLVRPEDIQRGSQDFINEFGRVKYYIPIYYTNRVEPENQSYDIPTIFFKFWESTNEYAHKRELLPELEMARYFINKRKAATMDVFRSIISKTSDTDDGDQEAILNDKTELADMLNDWFELAIYGKFTSTKNQNKTFIKRGKRRAIDVLKFIDFLNRYTSLNLLGGNFIQGTANVVIGEVMQSTEVIAGEYVSAKNYTRAHALYMANLPKVLGDTVLVSPESLYGRIYDEFNVLDEEVSDITFSKNTATGRFLRNTSVYFIQHCGEHYLQNRFLLAMLLEKKAYDKDGKELGSMLHQYEIKNNKLVLKENVDLKKSNWTEKDQQEFKRKIRGILSRMHGEYSELGRVALQRNALGRMAYLFRKFVVPGFRRRWGSEKYIERLGQYVEGNYITTWRFFSQISKDLIGLKFAIMSEKWDTLSDHHKANIKRTLSEITFLLTAVVLASALYSLRDDDDEYNNLIGFLSYQAYRLKAELLFWTPKLDEAWSILRSPMASMSVIQNLIDLSSQLAHPSEIYQRGPWKGQLKIKKDILNFIPFYKQIYKGQDMWQQLQWFKN